MEVHSNEIPSKYSSDEEEDMIIEKRQMPQVVAQKEAESYSANKAYYSNYQMEDDNELDRLMKEADDSDIE